METQRRVIAGITAAVEPMVLVPERRSYLPPARVPALCATQLDRAEPPPVDHRRRHVTRHRLLALLLTAIAASGCSLVTPSEAVIAATTITCDPIQLDPPPALECESAVLAALGQIDESAIVATASFHHGAPCAPNMRCRFGPLDRGYVVLRLVDGRCAYALVGVDAIAVEPPRVSASTLEAWPPAAWLEMGVPADLDCR